MFCRIGICYAKNHNIHGNTPIASYFSKAQRIGFKFYSKKKSAIGPAFLRILRYLLRKNFLTPTMTVSFESVVSVKAVANSYSDFRNTMTLCIYFASPLILMELRLFSLVPCTCSKYSQERFCRCALQQTNFSQ